MSCQFYPKLVLSATSAIKEAVNYFAHTLIRVYKDLRGYYLNGPGQVKAYHTNVQTDAPFFF